MPEIKWGKSAEIFSNNGLKDKLEDLAVYEAGLNTSDMNFLTHKGIRAVYSRDELTKGNFYFDSNTELSYMRKLDLDKLKAIPAPEKDKSIAGGPSSLILTY